MTADEVRAHAATANTGLQPTLGSVRGELVAMSLHRAKGQGRVRVRLRASLGGQAIDGPSFADHIADEYESVVHP